MDRTHKSRKMYLKTQISIIITIILYIKYILLIIVIFNLQYSNKFSTFITIFLDL